MFLEIAGLVFFLSILIDLYSNYYYAFPKLAIFADFFWTGRIKCELTIPLLCVYDSEMLGWLSLFSQRAEQIREEKVKSIVGPEFISEFNSSAQRQPDFNMYITETMLLELLWRQY